MSFIASPPPSRHGGGYFPRSNSARTPYPTLERPDLFPLLRSLQEDPSFAEVLRASESKETKRGKRMSRTSTARGKGGSGLGGVGSPGLWPGLLAPSRSGSSHIGGEGRRTQTPAERYAAQHRRQSQVISTASSAVGSQLAPEVQEAPRAYTSNPHQGVAVPDGRQVGLWELLERPAGSGVNTTAPPKGGTAPLKHDPLPQPPIAPPAAPSLPSALALCTVDASLADRRTVAAQTKTKRNARRSPEKPDKSDRDETVHLGGELSRKSITEARVPLRSSSSPATRLRSMFKSGRGASKNPEDAAKIDRTSAPNLHRGRCRTSQSSFSTFASLSLSQFQLSPSSHTSLHLPHPAPVQTPRPRLQARDDIASLPSLDSETIWESRKRLLEVLREGPPADRRASGEENSAPRVNSAAKVYQAGSDASQVVRSRSADDLGSSGQAMYPRESAPWSTGAAGEGKLRSGSTGFRSYGSRWEWEEVQGPAAEVQKREAWKLWRGWAREKRRGRDDRNQA